MSDDPYAKALAHHILRGDDAPHGRMHDAAVGTVMVEISGMVKTIKREIWADAASIAQKIETELDSKMMDVNIDKMIANAVKTEIDSIGPTISRMVTDVLNKKISNLIENAVDNAISPYRHSIANQIRNSIRGSLDGKSEHNHQDTPKKPQRRG